MSIDKRIESSKTVLLADRSGHPAGGDKRDMSDSSVGLAAETAVSGRRVLVAEDSSVTQDLLKLLLTQRGHHVEIVKDGPAAIAALRAGAYDVALLDFHLPGMDGLQVASACRAELGEARPRFVAITADIEGLLAHTENCENFDEIVPKPLDIYDVCNVVEGGQAAHAGSPAAGRAPNDPPVDEAGARTPAAGEPAAGAASRSAAAGLAIQNIGFEFLQWPEDFDPGRLSARTVQAMHGAAVFDAVLVREPARAAELAAIWQRRHLHLLPVVDLTGALGPRADLDGSTLGFGETEAVRRLVDGFHERRARLHEDLLLTGDFGEKLLGRIFVQGDCLRAGYDPAEPGLIVYNTLLDPAEAEREAEALRSRGLVERDFFDRLQRCDRCGSSRFTVREECPQCHAPDIIEEASLHHFRCAHQAPESDFRVGDALVCPKCRRELSHFSVDYDKPGTLIRCRGGGHVASAPRVGFVCLDCLAHYDGEAVPTRDAYSHRLTDLALDFLEAGHGFLGPAQQRLRYSALPLELVVALNGEARRYNEERTPFALIDISYQREREVTREVGARQFEQTRDLFLENLHSLLRKEDKVFKGQGSDFALLRATGPEEARDALDYLSGTASSQLRLDLGITMHVFGPEDFV